MKKAIILAGCALALFTASKPVPAVEQTSGIDRTNLDTTANPVDDFYQYACGGWMQKHPMTAEYARYGSFDKLAEENQARLKEIITGVGTQHNTSGSIPDKIATLYRLGMDSAKLQQQGAAPIRPLLETIAGLSTRKQLQGELITLHKNGVSPFFDLTSEADYSNSKMTIAWLYQGGIAMGERSYYLDNDDRTKDIRAKYQ